MPIFTETAVSEVFIVSSATLKAKSFSPVSSISDLILFKTAERPAFTAFFAELRACLTISLK